MRRRKDTLVVFSLLILIFSCCKRDKWEGRIYTENEVTVVENEGLGLWGKETEKKIIFTEDITLGVEEGEDYLMFHHLRNVAVDSDLNMYILDGGNYRLLKFDKDGNFIWSTGRKGQGPGEFQYPGKVIITHDGEIVVSDSRSLNFFDAQGKYKRTVKIGKSFRNVTFLTDGRMFINIFLLGQPGIAAEYYSADGEFIKKFPDEYRYGPKMSPNLGASIGGGYFQLVGDKIYFSVPDQYEIREYDLEGNILRKIRRDVKLKPPNIIVRSGGRGVSVRPSDSSGPCFIIQDEIFINCLEIVEKKSEEEYVSERFLDFFNEKGQFLGSYKLPENYLLNVVDSDNKFYFAQWDPFSKVIRLTMKLQ